MIERGLLLADSLGKKEYTCPILNAKFVLISAGTFMMGSPEDEPGISDKETLQKEADIRRTPEMDELMIMLGVPVDEPLIFDETLHQVTISKPFYLQTTPVTQGQWKKVMRNYPSDFKGDDNLPVEQVSWNDVQEFIEKLNVMEGTEKYRLPTEAEWEYACRAGSTTAYCFGNDPGRLADHAWYLDNAGEKTHPVGQKKSNAWGLYDMHGNVEELCQDWYRRDYPSDSVTDPVGPSNGKRRVSRGGLWFHRAWFCRSARRGPTVPDFHPLGLGFRLLALSGHREIKSEVLINEQVTSEKLKKLFRLGEEKGFLTYDDVNDMLPSDVIMSDQIDEIIRLFREKNINIIDPDKVEKLIVKKPTTRETSRKFRGQNT